MTPTQTPAVPAAAIQQSPWVSAEAVTPATTDASPRRGGRINATPAAWWWAGGTLAGLLALSVALAWLVNR